MGEKGRPLLMQTLRDILGYVSPNKFVASCEEKGCPTWLLKALYCKKSVFFYNLVVGRICQISQVYQNRFLAACIKS